MFWRRGKRAREHKVLDFGGGDCLTLKDLFSSVLITGAPSSAKTTAGVGNLALGVLSHPEQPSVVVVPAKVTDGEQWERWHARSGSRLPFRRFDRKEQFNWLEYNLTEEGGVNGLLPIFEGMNQLMTQGQPQGADSFFQPAGINDLLQGVRACWFGNGRVCVREVYDFLTSAPTNDEDLHDDTTFAMQTLTRLHARPKTDEIEHCLDYFCSDRPRLGKSEKTLACVESVALNMLRPFMTGMAGDTMGGPESTITPDHLEDGMLLFLDMPMLTGHISAKLAAAIWMFSINRYALRRKGGRPIIAFLDEYQRMAVRGEDAMIAAVGRSASYSRVIVMQTLLQAESVLGGGDSGRQEAHALVACMGTIIGFANGCVTNNKHLSDVLGQEPQMLFGGSSESGGESFDIAGHILGTWQPKAHCSFSQHLQPVLIPQQFLQLRTGGEANNFVADAVVIAANRTFADGRPFKFVSLKQVF